MFRRRRGNNIDGIDDNARRTLSASPTAMIAEDEQRSESPYPSPRPSPKQEKTKTLGSPPQSASPFPADRVPRRRFTRRFSSSSSLPSRSTTYPPYGTSRPSPPPTSSMLPLVLTFVVPFASFITGSDLLRDAVLLLFLVFYLHQLIKIPWELYLSARPRHKQRITDDESTTSTHTQSHLHMLELLYLTLSIVSPLLGSIFLRSISSKLGLALTSDRKPLSWFSTTLFALVSGLRPWNHLIERLRGHTEGLHGLVEEEIRASNPSPEEMLEEEDEAEELLDEMAEKLELLEKATTDLKATVTTLERRAWRAERSYTRDRKKLIAVEESLRVLRRSATTGPISNGQVSSNEGHASPLLVKWPNPIFHPLSFIVTCFTSILFLLFTPIFLIFPSLSPSTPSSKVPERSIHFHPSSQVLEIVREEEADELRAGEGVNEGSDEELDFGNLSDRSDGTVKLGSKNGHLPSVTGIGEIVFRRPANAAYAFLTGVLKHWL